MTPPYWASALPETASDPRRSPVLKHAHMQALPEMEPAGIEPATSCLQIEGEDIWKDVDLEDIYF
jgi:hypothetical protein